MPLFKIRDFDPNYRTYFDNQDIIGYDLYSGNDKVGSVDDILVDENSKFRYLVVNTGIWILGKKILLPVGRARMSHSDRRIYVDGLTKAQVENLPEYHDSLTVDYDYEERVRGAYRQGTGATAAATYDRNTYTYDRDQDLYGTNDRDHQNLRLYEERLIANKTRQKSGEVLVGKDVEVETQRVSVPVEKERVVVERVNSDGVNTPVTPGADAFTEGEVARVEVYEETPEIRKEAYVREEVQVRKEVERETVEAEEQLRREELDVRTEGRPVVDRRPDRTR
ncbi:DUF2382 domain-containing protein [Desertifilum sp. FACHB-1129]|uniref:Photosystem reaction center subunit H n=1 Tax=Desertifilum tharense IPPAS B-1220 TaxID=1781255 RepID=A0A1E5QI24_9CYAN|nr:MULTISPECIES: DUF2382 domain-containing protein [Desertifilum]MDA0212060.1 DUF2382 domain-containing protein [Cyanobacteria bacterium FC1]MBD2314423.1 DUF2382 domain-containing protein [Desertifilum sp. FACHB-1129]MBD2324882.1 DUF2382 domain-containing protein [Desertifilum sp. FACHB-866]MBD2334974.1 DUF2382 domain-containing protein [Desertifilum sp. FACHB-868]OEJ74310.1 photosystem reaction center subunit H [Desertifilum tharense IPPAS B-1220]